ncbi:RHS repeat-associated core domain-containing protein [Acidovorax sp. SUPP2539]|uniref:RHS repeat-associated core domain-containing protein n=1 Tax=Acidovorax sp. SUPP2539 TaxID=2920878 RepID=UPI0032E9D9B9
MFDQETQLNYNLHRSYDPPSGRYFQADPIGLEGGWNRFGYVGGDPLNAIDPQGLNAVVIANRAAAWVQGAYYRYGPAITEFIAGASGVNGAVVSPMSPLVAQIPTSVSRMTPVARAVIERVESGGFVLLRQQVAQLLCQMVFIRKGRSLNFLIITTTNFGPPVVERHFYRLKKYFSHQRRSRPIVWRVLIVM